MDILQAVTDKDRLDFSQNFNIKRAYDGDREFPDIKTQYLEAEYLRLSDSLQLPMAAMVHAFDSEAHLGKRPTAEKVTMEKLLIKEKINQSERVQLLKDKGVAGTESLLQYIFNDAGRLAENVKTRTEVAKMEVLATGKMTIKENNLDLSVEYGVSSDNRFTLTWDDPDHDILGDIQGIVDYAHSIGKNPTRAKTSSNILMKMRKNNSIQKAIGGIYMAGVMPTLTQINALMMEDFGFTITINDAVYGYEGTDGKKTSARYFDRNTFSLYTVGVNGAIGTGLWGVTPEENAQGPWGAKSAQQFITIAQWATPDPVAVWTKASGLFIPVLPDPNGLFIATVSQDTLGTLTVTSVAGTNSGTTKVTVAPALTSGNSYKFKTGASLTTPTYNQLISQGYTNWDGVADISATTGNSILIVEVDASGKAKKVGQATVVSKA
ncbi:MAG TPA: major capsid protein [Oscillospiraceae bacterium]|nr:major capsid protein [Oscillospiraceae bacterium]